MQTKVLILAAGDQRDDWTEDTPCQLALVAGEPLILRTLRQLEERGYDENVITVTHNEAIKAAVPQYRTPRFRRWWAETLLATHKSWAERTIVLNGDVIFSPVVLDAALADDGPIGFHGSPGEVYAVVFTAEIHDHIRAALTLAIVDAPKSIPVRRGRGLVWQFYRAFNGFDLHKHKHNMTIYRLAPEDDYTYDIDRSVKKYQGFLARYEWARS